MREPNTYFRKAHPSARPRGRIWIQLPARLALRDDHNLHLLGHIDNPLSWIARQSLQDPARPRAGNEDLGDPVPPPEIDDSLGDIGALENSRLNVQVAGKIQVLLD